MAAHFAAMDLAGVRLTADAAHTTKANARQLTQGNGADYLMSLKGNQRCLCAGRSLYAHNRPNLRKDSTGPANYHRRSFTPQA